MLRPTHKPADATPTPNPRRKPGHHATARPHQRRHATLALCLFAALATATLPGCASVCPETLARRDADPAWQKGSVPAMATAYIGSGVAREALRAWGEQSVDLFRRPLEEIPAIGQFARVAKITIEVPRLRFEPTRDARPGTDVVFAVKAKAGPRGDAGLLQQIAGGMGAIQVELELRAPLQIVARRGSQDAELRLGLERLRIAVTSVEFGPFARKIDRDQLLGRLHSLLAAKGSVAIARIAPMAHESVPIRARPVALRPHRPDQLAVDIEFPDIAAPPGPATIALAKNANPDAVHLTLAPEQALAIGDWGLRVAGKKGFDRDGSSGGPYYARLASLTVQDGKLALETHALRCAGLCAHANVQLQLATRHSSDGLQVQIDQARVTNASLPGFLVGWFMPSHEALSQKATAATRNVLEGSSLQIPMLRTHRLVFDTIHIQGTALVSTGRLVKADTTPGARP